MAWSPLTDVGNLAVWLDASQQTGIVNGGSVASATDFSGNSRDATQGTPAKQPTFLSGIQNGLPVMRFDGSNDGLVTPSITWVGVQVSVFLVCSITPIASSLVVELSPNFNVTTAWLLAINANVLEAGHRISATYSVFNTAATVTGAWHSLGYVGDGGLATNEATGFVDGDAAGTRPFNSNTVGVNFSAHPIYVGSRGDTSLFTQMDLGELLVFDKALSQSEREAVEGYLAWKWGLVANLPALHPYKLEPPGGFPVTNSPGADGPDDLAARREQIRQRDFIARQRDDEEVLEAVAQAFTHLCR